jgi:hypothetical protein
LLEVEAIPPTVNWVAITVDGYPQDEVAYHARLALDEGFIEAKFLPGTFDFNVKRLTFAGHEFWTLRGTILAGIARKRK